MLLTAERKAVLWAPCIVSTQLVSNQVWTSVENNSPTPLLLFLRLCVILQNGSEQSGLCSLTANALPSFFMCHVAWTNRGRPSF